MGSFTLGQMAKSSIVKKLKEKVAERAKRARAATVSKKGALARLLSPAAGFAGGAVAGIIDERLPDATVGDTPITWGQLGTVAAGTAMGLASRDTAVSTLAFATASGAAGAAGYGVGRDLFKGGDEG